MFALECLFTSVWQHFSHRSICSYVVCGCMSAQFAVVSHPCIGAVHAANGPEASTGVLLQKAVISNVSPDVLYLFRVQAVCQHDLRSDFSQTLLFRGAWSKPLQLRCILDDWPESCRLNVCTVIFPSKHNQNF